MLGKFPLNNEFNFGLESQSDLPIIITTTHLIFSFLFSSLK